MEQPKKAMSTTGQNRLGSFARHQKPNRGSGFVLCMVTFSKYYPFSCEQICKEEFKGSDPFVLTLDIGKHLGLVVLALALDPDGEKTI